LGPFTINGVDQIAAENKTTTAMDRETVLDCRCFINVLEALTVNAMIG